MTTQQDNSTQTTSERSVASVQPCSSHVYKLHSVVSTSVADHDPDQVNTSEDKLVFWIQNDTDQHLCNAIDNIYKAGSVDTISLPLASICPPVLNKQLLTMKTRPTDLFWITLPPMQRQQPTMTHYLKQVTEHCGNKPVILDVTKVVNTKHSSAPEIRHGSSNPCQLPVCSTHKFDSAISAYITTSTHQEAALQFTTA